MKLHFHGGEPTIDFEELLECIMYVKAKNKKVTIITNATLLDDEKIEMLCKLKVDTFEITINSFDYKIHEQINNIPKSFQKSIDVIKKLKAKDVRVVVPIVLTKYNVNEIEKTLQFIYGLGIDEIMINRYNIGGEGCNKYNDILANKDDLKNAYEKCQQFAENNKVKLYSLVCTPHCVIDPENYPNIFFSNCGINNLNRRYTLTRDGNIRYCNHSPENIGNIYDEKIKNILKSEKLQAWSKIEPNFCAGCKRKDECQYGCRAASQQMGLSMKNPDPIVNIYDAKPFI